MSHDVFFNPGDLIHVPGNAFLVEKVLGAGGMGAVYWVVDKELDEPRVIKVLHPEHARDRADLVERFLREARAMTKVKHPNIVRVIALYKLMDAHKSPAFSMEALRGDSVADVLQKGIEAPHRALHVYYQTLAGLDAMHQRGLVHRDIKPANLLLYNEEGREDLLVKILDFGVVRIIVDEKDYEGFVGTFAYASDRQLTGKLAEPQDDVWAASMVLYELLTGSHAFEEFGMSKDGALARVGKAPRTLKQHGLDFEDLDELLQKALHPKPSERFQDAFSAMKVVKKLHKSYLERFQVPTKASSTTEDREHAPRQDPITQALLSPTKPDAPPPEWLAMFRDDIAKRRIIVQPGSAVEQHGPTTPGPRARPRKETVDERLARPRGGSTVQSAGAPSAPPISSEPSPAAVRLAPTVQPSQTPAMPIDDGGVTYVPVSKSERPPRKSAPVEKKPGPRLLLLVHAHDDVPEGSFLMEEFPFVLGREKPADLVLPHRGVSTEHATIDFDGENYLLTDHGSTNGSHVREDGKLKQLDAEKPYVLKDGLSLYLGPINIDAYLGTVRSPESLTKKAIRGSITPPKVAAKKVARPKPARPTWIPLLALVVIVLSVGYLYFRSKGSP